MTATSNAKNLVTMAYSNGTFIELIQPILRKSIFKDYMNNNNNPTGGVQHIAYSTHIEKLDKVISGFAKKSFTVISSFNTPIDNFVFFDARKKIGIFTEIMGITKEGKRLFKK